MHFSTWSCQHVCFLYFGCIYWQHEPPTEDVKGKNNSSHFSVKNEGCVYKNSQFFSAIFPAKQTTQSGDLNGHANRKNWNKNYSMPCQVISNFGWLDPRLLPLYCPDDTHLPGKHLEHLWNAIHTPISEPIAISDIVSCAMERPLPLEISGASRCTQETTSAYATFR